MTCLRMENLNPSLQAVISPFFHEILEKSAVNIHSIYLVGGVVTGDSPEKGARIDSVIVLQKMDLAFLDVLAPLGKKYGKAGLAAPLIMDPAYIKTSLDVFPLEFLNFQLAHEAVYGEDLLAGLAINKQELRYQCERELKGKLIWLHRIYVSAMGDAKVLAGDIVRHFDGYPPVFRGILHLLGEEAPGNLKAVLARMDKLTGLATGVFAETYAIKNHLAQPSQEEISSLFRDFYTATAKLAEVVDGIQIQ